MIVANRQKAWFLAGVCTMTSVGGVLGYAIGYYLYANMGNGLFKPTAKEAFNNFHKGFAEWGFGSLL